MPDLPVNVDSAYADDATHPDIKLHQQHHDAIHDFYNLWSQAIDDNAWPDGGIPFWVDSLGEFQVLDPTITGSPGPPGPTGQGFTHEGVWNSGTTYQAYDVVIYGKNAYVSRTTHSNSTPTVDGSGLPTVSTNWNPFAAGGADGTNGSDGTDGPQGPAGPTGPSGPAEEALVTILAAGATQTLDANDASFFILTLNDDLDLSLIDSAGRAVSAITIELTQGVGAPYLVTWTDAIIWHTADGLAPTLSDTEDETNVITLYQVGGIWRGFASSLGVAPPPVTYATLALDVLASVFIGTDQTTSYTTPNSYQLGSGRIGHAFVVTTRTDADPVIPTLAGGGAGGGAGTGAWTQGGTRVVGTTTNRRRVTHFVNYDAVTGTAAPFVVSNGGADCTGLGLVVVRTPVAPSSGVALSISKDVTNGGVNSAPTVTLAAPADAANRPLGCLVRDASAATYTPEANQIVVQALTMTGPVAQIHVCWDPGSFSSNNMSGSLSAANTWGWVATELEQG